jgi:hypothetical protein
MNYEVATTPAVKNTITVTRRELWKNYLRSWADIVMDSPELLNNLTHFQKVAKILCDGELDYKIRQLFRQGETVLLMGDAMEYIDMEYIDTDNHNTLVEIVVTDGEKSVVVNHNNISY